MTKASRCLAIAVTVFAVVFMGVAAVMWTVRTDWKHKAQVEFPKKQIDEQNARLTELQKEIESVDKQQKDAVAHIASDVRAIGEPASGRVAQLEKELEELIEKSHAIAGQVEVDAKKVHDKQEVDKRLREEIARLQSQYDDLVAQKQGALADVQKTRDLLFQARGVLERAERRSKALKAQGAQPGKYDADNGGSEPTASRPTRAVQ
ncbi:MAG TPA: hypothetical protein VKU82_09075 [Planctomycetaceae bacterium]|nr:hypothetical protein [Planctomycetaceae bacterium]